MKENLKKNIWYYVFLICNVFLMCITVELITIKILFRNCPNVDWITFNRFAIVIGIGWIMILVYAIRSYKK